MLLRSSQILKAVPLLVLSIVLNLGLAQNSLNEENYHALAQLNSIEDSLHYLSQTAPKTMKRDIVLTKSLIQELGKLAKTNNNEFYIKRSAILNYRLIRLKGQHRTTLKLIDSLLADQSIQQFKKLYADALKDKADMHNRLGEYDISLNTYSEAKNIYENEKDSNSIALIYRGMSSVARRIGNYDVALDHCQKSIAISKKKNHIGNLAVAYNSLGIIYKDLKQWEEAQQAYLKSLEYHQNDNNRSGVANAFVNLGNTAGAQGNNSKSIEYFNQAVKLFEELGNFRALAGIHYNLSISYKSDNNLQKALQSNLMSLKAFQNMKVDPPARIFVSLGELYTALGRREKANEYLELGRNAAEKSGRVNFMNSAYEISANSYAAMGNYKKAYNAHVDFKNLNDSIFNVEMNSKFKELETTYEVKEKDNQIATLETKQKQQKVIQYFILGSLALFMLIAALLWRISQIRRKTNIELADKNKIIAQKNEKNELLLKEIHHRVKNNLQVISSLLQLQSEQTEDSGTIEILKEGQDRVYSMALIHQNLYQDENLNSVKVDEYLQKLTQNLFDSYNISPERVNLVLDIDQVNLDVDTLIPLGLIINELVSNSLKYAYPNNNTGTIKVSLKERNSQIILLVQDDGIGYKERDLEKLGKTFGYRLIHAFKKQLSADLQISSNEGISVELRISDYQLAS